MKNNIETYGYIDKYYIDKRIFRVAFILLFLLIIIAFGSNDWEFKTSVYVSCASQEPFCENPYYDYELLYNKPCPHKGLCDQEILYGGESYGKKPSVWFSAYLGLTILIILFAFVMNHIIHNTKRNKK